MKKNNSAHKTKSRIHKAKKSHRRDKTTRDEAKTGYGRDRSRVQKILKKSLSFTRNERIISKCEKRGFYQKKSMRWFSSPYSAAPNMWN